MDIPLKMKRDPSALFFLSRIILTRQKHPNHAASSHLISKPFNPVSAP
jgi:hypothetical protein